MALIDLIAPGLGPIASLGPFAINPTTGIAIASTSPRSGSSSKYLAIDVNSAAGTFAKQFSVDKARSQVMFAVEATNWLTNGTIFSFSHIIYQVKDSSTNFEMSIGVEWDAGGVPRFFAEIKDGAGAASQRNYWSVTIVEGTWYVIEADFNCGANPWTIDWKIKPDGGSYTAGTQVSLALAANTMRYYYTGVNGVSSMQTKMQDIHIADGTAYYGDHKTETVQVDAVGTHVLDTTGATPSVFFDKVVSGTPTALSVTGDTTSYTTIQDNPLDADGNYIRIKPNTAGPPATPAFRAAGTVAASANNVANGAFATGPGAPAGKAVGDFLVLIISSTHNAFTVTTPTGWTLATSKASGTALGGKIFVYTRIADGTAADTPNPVLAGLTTGTTGTPAQAVILAYQNVTETQDAAAVSSDLAAQTTTSVIPSITTTVDKDLVLGIAIKMGETAAQTSTVATFTERVDVSTTSGTGYIMEVSDLAKTPAGATSATVTWSATGSQRALTVSLSFKATLTTTQPANTQYAEYTLANPAATTVDALWVAAALANDTANASSSVDLRLRETVGNTEANVHSGVLNSATKIYKNAVFPTKPGTATAWDTAAVNGLRLRYGYTASATGNLGLHAVELVVSFPVVGATPISGTDANSTTTEGALVTIRPTDDSGTSTETITNRTIVADADGVASPVEVAALRVYGTDVDGTPVETAAIAVPIAASDTAGTPTETAVPTAAVAGADSDSSPLELAGLRLVATDVDGTPVELAAIAVPVSGSDAGSSSVESGGIRTVATDLNTAVVDTGALVAAIPAADASGSVSEVIAGIVITIADINGTVQETFSLVALETASDSGSESDTAFIAGAGNNINASDSGVGSGETGQALAKVPGTETGVSLETAVPVATVLGQDSNLTLLDVVVLVARMTLTDLGAGVDTATPLVPVSGSDLGTASEIANKALSVSDASTAAEVAALTRVLYTSSDAATAEDLATLLAALSGIDSVAAFEAAIVSIPGLLEAINTGRVRIGGNSGSIIFSRIGRVSG